MEDLWTTPSTTSKITESPLMTNTPTRELPNLANPSPLISKSLPTLTSPKTPCHKWLLPSRSTPSLLPSMPLVSGSNSTNLESSPTNVEPLLITEFLPSDTDLITEKTTTSLRILGDLLGEMPDTSNCLKKMELENVESTCLPLTLLPEIMHD